MELDEMKMIFRVKEASSISALGEKGKSYDLMPAFFSVNKETPKGALYARFNRKNLPLSYISLTIFITHCLDLDELIFCDLVV